MSHRPQRVLESQPVKPPRAESPSIHNRPEGRLYASPAGPTLQRYNAAVAIWRPRFRGR